MRYTQNFGWSGFLVRKLGERILGERICMRGFLGGEKGKKWALK